jgi:16S rRNA (cytosine1402-N4)-methyltransferase
MADPSHAPVLPEESLALLAPAPGDVIVDCTAGRGGHARLLAQQLDATGTIVLLDVDSGNLEFARGQLAELPCTVHAVHGSFGLAHRSVADLGLKANVVLADLGFASNQMDDPQRGLGFRHDGPLDMRLDQSKGRTAAEILATCSVEELTEIIGSLGEEPFAGRIARKVVQARESEPIENTGQLAQLVRNAYGRRAATSRMDPATRTFMGLRIAVNDELAALEALLAAIARGAEATKASSGWMHSGARVGIISFHSLEDRPVKHAFSDLARRKLATVDTRRPITASEAEQRANRRSRSAKLRVVTLS